MKAKLFTLLLLVLLTCSCQSDFEKDLNIHMISSSKLTVKIVDSKGNSIANTNIKIYDKSVFSSGSSSNYKSLNYIDSRSSDSNGLVDFGDIASGTYYLLIDSVRVNGQIYHPAMQFQMNSSVDKKITINPEEFVATFNFNFQKAETSKLSNTVKVTPFENLNVIFVPASKNISGYSLDKIISESEVKGKTDITGLVSMKVPSYTSYKIFLYNNEKTNFLQLGISDQYSSYTTTFSGDKEDNITNSYTLDSKTYQTVSFGTYKLAIKKSVLLPTNSSFTLSAFEGLNVAVIPANKYQSGSPLATLLESAELTGKTDVNGEISFSLKSNSNYSLVAYNDKMTIWNKLPLDYAFAYAGENKQTAITIDPTTLGSVYYNTINLNISKTSSTYYTPYPTDLTPFSNLKVILLPYLSSNSTSKVDDLLPKAIASGTTDGSGQLIFTIPTSNYSGYYSYQIVAYDDTKTKKFVSSNISVYSGNSTSLSYSLNATTYANVN